MTIRRCVLTAGHDGGHMFALEDRPKLRGADEPRCAAYDPPPTDGMPFAPYTAEEIEQAQRESFTLTAPTPPDVADDHEPREIESTEQSVCPHCGFAPVSHEEWKRTVLENYGANAGAVLVEMTQRAFDLGRMAGKLEAEAIARRG